MNVCLFFSVSFFSFDNFYCFIFIFTSTLFCLLISILEPSSGFFISLLYYSSIKFSFGFVVKSFSSLLRLPLWITVLCPLILRTWFPYMFWTCLLQPLWSLYLLSPASGPTHFLMSVSFSSVLLTLCCFSLCLVFYSICMFFSFWCLFLTIHILPCLDNFWFFNYFTLWGHDWDEHCFYLLK